MPDVGLRLTMTENVSAIAPKISESIRGMSRAGEDMKDALDLGRLEEQYKSYAERIDKIHDIQVANRRETTRQKQQDGDGVGIGARMQQAPQVIRGAGGAVQQLGQTGDVAAAGGNVAGMLGGMMKSLGGPAGLIVGGAIATMAGGLLVANMISKQYEKFMPEIMSLTAAFGGLADTAEETGESFSTTLDMAGATAEKFGYSLEEGLRGMRIMAEAGIGRDQGASAMENVMGYARGMGASPEALARYRAQAIRFGGQDRNQNVLGIAAGGLAQAGMGAGQFQEYLNATLSIFEEGLSRGVVQGFEDINVAQTWIAQLGEAFKGQYGLNLYRKMEGAMIGGTELTSEKDVIMFRAARRAMAEEGLDTRNMTGVMKYMESGAESMRKMFPHVREIVREMTGGDVLSQVELMRELYKVNYTVAEAILGLKDADKITELAAIKADSPQMRLLQVQETIKNEIVDLAEDVSAIKARMLERIPDLIGDLKGLVPTEAGGTGAGKEMLGERLGLGEITLPGGGITGMLRKLRRRKADVKYGAGASATGEVIESLLGTLSLEQIGPTLDTLETRALEHWAAGEGITQTGMGAKEITGYDATAVLRELVKVLDNLGVVLTQEQTLNVTNIIGEIE